MSLRQALASRRLRIFLVTWVVYSSHFATNIVREHYPAFAIADHLTFRVDEYLGLHPDIFEHRDGHAYIGNQVLVSAIAAIPLFVFDPLLDAVEARTRERMAAGGDLRTEYRTDHPNARAFFAEAKRRGLHERFGAAAFVTSTFLMAPFGGLFLVAFYDLLRRRDVAAHDATWLVLLLGFGTPLFFRHGHLNHNLFIMYTAFAAFCMLWRGAEGGASPRRTFVAGLLAGTTLAIDYVGLVLLPLLFLYLLVSGGGRATGRLRPALHFVAGTVPPIAFLLYSQWAMFGNPLLPGQYWMPDNSYSGAGFRGMSWPTLDLVFRNLFDPAYGLLPFGPILALAAWPPPGARRGAAVLGRRERVFVLLLFAAVVLFFAANRYSYLQFGTGFRYLVPLVPFLFLAAADRLLALGRGARRVWVAACVLHSWVLAAVRESVPRSWSTILTEGPQLPWLTVLRKTSGDAGGLLFSPWLPTLLLAVIVATATLIWYLPPRLAAGADGP